MEGPVGALSVLTCVLSTCLFSPLCLVVFWSPFLKMKVGVIRSALSRLLENNNLQASSSGLCECTPLLGLALSEIMQYQAVSGLVL